MLSSNVAIRFDTTTMGATYIVGVYFVVFIEPEAMPKMYVLSSEIQDLAWMPTIACFFITQRQQVFVTVSLSL